MAESGTIFPTATSLRAASSSTKCVSWRILTCVGRPRLRLAESSGRVGLAGREGSDTAQDLLRKPVILERSRRPGSKREDRLSVRRALFQANALGDDGVEDLDAEDALDLFEDVLCEQRPLVVHGDQRAQDLQLWIGPELDLVDGFEQVVVPSRAK